jgi:hypothetical protein
VHDETGGKIQIKNAGIHGLVQIIKQGTGTDRVHKKIIKELESVTNTHVSYGEINAGKTYGKN